MRFIPFVIVIAMASPAALAQDPPALRDVRAVAESMVVASGPVRATSSHAYTPLAWSTDRTLGGTYRDVSARHRYTRYTYGWHGWYSYRSHCGPRWQAYGSYRCW